MNGMRILSAYMTLDNHRNLPVIASFVLSAADIVLDLLVRIRDNCVIFDPLQRLQLYSPDDPAHHIGLRMIVGTAKDVQYTSVLKLNNLVLRL